MKWTNKIKSIALTGGGALLMFLFNWGLDASKSKVEDIQHAKIELVKNTKAWVKRYGETAKAETSVTETEGSWVIDVYWSEIMKAPPSEEYDIKKKVMWPNHSLKNFIGGVVQVWPGDLARGQVALDWSDYSTTNYPGGQITLSKKTTPPGTYYINYVYKIKTDTGTYYTTSSVRVILR